MKVNIARDIRQAEVQLDTFLRELTELCRRHQLGITGAPVLFVMEREDSALAYKCDAKSHLMLVSE